MGSMQGTSLAETEGFVKALFYGNPKQGKTTAMAGAARLGKIVAVDIEGDGWLAKPLRKRGIPVENIIKFTPSTYAEMEQVFWEIKGMFDDADDTGDPELAPVAVCIDHLSELQRRLVRDVVVKRQSKARKALEGKLNNSNIEVAKVAKDALEDLNPFFTEIPDYGVWTNQANHLVRLFRDLPCHVAFGAHYQEERGVKVPGLTQKFRIDFTGSMAMILGCQTMQVGDSLAYVAITREIEGWQGGDRFDVLKPMIVNPSFDRVIMAAQGKLDFDTDPEQQAFKAAL